jgi:hypothetical protein
MPVPGAAGLRPPWFPEPGSTEPWSVPDIQSGAKPDTVFRQPHRSAAAVKPAANSAHFHLFKFFSISIASMSPVT